ncbi:hypothetical protein [Dactylosporangium sp. CS-033363]|uniref:hypothetical protein n=1 Tax=Dactylosporangium sp. CS-033363 TaxID=3239935 RepID=UPI003D8F032C
MSLFGKRDDWKPPLRPDCACREHEEDVLGLVIPNADWDEDPTFAALLETGSLGVSPLEAGDRFMTVLDGPSLGPFHWVMWAADEIYGCYDDDAELPVDRALAEQAGVELVEWYDREEFRVGAAGLCRSGMLAVVARALLDPRIRVAGGDGGGAVVQDGA